MACSLTSLSACRRRLTAFLSVLLLILALVLTYSILSVSYTLSGNLLPIAYSQMENQKSSFVADSSEVRRLSRSALGSKQGKNCSSKGVKRFPTALIIGVRKGGTRALLEMLKMHPDIVTARNELHYFDRDENFVQGVQWYIDKMPHSTRTQITMEKSPSYFVSKVAAERIHAIAPKTKIILIVRNPIERTVSDYMQLLRKRRSGHTFEGDVLLSPLGNGDSRINTGFSPVSVSMYDVHFERWLAHFNQNQIIVVDGNLLIDEPLHELKRIESFLEIDRYFNSDMFYFNATKGFYCWKRSNNGQGKQTHDLQSSTTHPYCLGTAKGHQLPQLSNHTVQMLLDFFRPHNERFFEQAKVRFEWEAPAYSSIGTTSKF